MMPRIFNIQIHSAGAIILIRGPLGDMITIAFSYLSEAEFMRIAI